MILPAAIIWIASLCFVTCDHIGESPPQLPVTLGYRLPNTIEPKSYEIKLTPYLLEHHSENEQFTFDGEVHIEILPKINTKFISFHSRDLVYSLKEYWPKDDSAKKYNFQEDLLNTTTNIWDIMLNEELVENTPYILHFIYKGTMSKNMLGFYRSSYINAKNETKWLGATHFQKTNARGVFPCFDEPKFKAIFQLTLVHHKSLKTVSNTRQRSSTINGDYITDVYQNTPKMSTYLLAFIISEFAERTNGNFSILSRSEFYDQTEYSFNYGMRIIAALEQYLDLKYIDLGIDKMHFAALPDFSPGAMENWGLANYRENGLLYDESSTKLSQKLYITGLIAHELSHMWFGNYITCDWWSYTWLNEALASYFEAFGVQLIEPNWHTENQVVIAKIHSVLHTDSLNGTSPLSNENTNTLTEILRAFNSITYSKGSSFIRMISHTLGETNFQKSLQKYLKKYAYSTVKPQNLLDCFKDNWPAATKPYADAIFRSFTEQVGYPVIQVKLANDGKSVEFSQKRFLLHKNDGSDENLVYAVPITYTTNVDRDFRNTTPKFVLPYTGTHNEQLSSEATWIIVNIQETGFYRVNYTETNWHAIHSALSANNWSNIHEINRAQIVNDLFSFALASEISYNLMLHVLEYLETEINYIPWTSAFNGFHSLSIRLGKDMSQFGNYIQQLTTKAYNLLGFEEKSNDSTLNINLREKILSWSCKYGNSDCISKAKKYFNTLSSKSVPKNIRSVIYCVGLREGGSKEFDLLYNKFKTETIATEKTLLQNSFGCVKRQELIERVFNLVLSDEIRRQDKADVLSTLYTRNNENVSPAFKLITTNYEQLAEAFGGYSDVASAISEIAEHFTTKAEENDLIAFNVENSHKFGDSASTLKRAETIVKRNLKWNEDKLGTVRTYLATRKNSEL